MPEQDPLLTEEGFPVIKVAPRKYETPPSFRRLSGNVIAANAFVVVLGLLGTPVAIVSPMSLGMAYGSASGFTDSFLDMISFSLLCVALIGFPFVCLGAVSASLYFGCRGDDRRAVAAALVPPFACIALVVLASALGD